MQGELLFGVRYCILHVLALALRNVESTVRTGSSHNGIGLLQHRCLPGTCILGRLHVKRHTVVISTLPPSHSRWPFVLTNSRERPFSSQSLKNASLARKTSCKPRRSSFATSLKILSVLLTWRYVKSIGGNDWY